MKKKIFLLTLFSVAILQLTACGGENKANNQENNQSTKTEFTEPDQEKREKIPAPVEPDAILESSDSAEDVEAQKERALEIDKAIWSRVLSADKNYTALLDNMESVESLYSISSFCGDLCNLMTTYSNDIENISDDVADDYIEYAKYYLAQIWDISKNVKAYADKMENKYLEKANNGMAAVGTLAQSTVEARFSYLSKCGFTNDEIIEIGESSAE